MKKINLILVFSIFLLIVGCGSASPEDTVNKFFNAAQNFDTEAMISVIAPSNTEDINGLISVTESEGEEDYPDFLFDYLKANAKEMTFNVTESNIENGDANVTVDVKYVDSGPVLNATIGEIFLQSFAQAFDDDEMSEEESEMLFDSIMKEQIDTIDKTYIETTLTIDLVKLDNSWYIREASDDLIDVVMSGFISAGKELGDSFSFDETDDNSLDTPDDNLTDAPEENIVEENPEDVLREINNFVTADLWNDGFIEIKSYLETGTGILGQDLDVDFTKSQLEKAMEKKLEYDDYIEDLDDSYSDIKEVWDKLSPEIDSLYQQVKSDAQTLNTDLFVQYSDAFYDLVVDLD